MYQSILFILYAAILAVCIFYFSRAEKLLIKVSIGLYAFQVLIPLINSFFDHKVINSAIFILTYGLAILVFAIHVIAAKLKLQNKLLLGLILTSLMLKMIITLFHLPLAEIIPVAYFMAIGIVIYLNIWHLSEIREEMRMADIFGIQMLLEIIL